MEYILGLDIGSTNLKAVLYDTDGNSIAEASAPTPVRINEIDLSIIDPDELWQIVSGLIRNTVAQLEEKAGPGAAGRILGTACASMAESGVMLDDKGEVTFPTIMWYDLCTKGSERYWNEEFDRFRLVEITGQRAQYNYSLNKLCWVKEHFPEAFAKTSLFLSMGDFIAYKLSGKAIMNHSISCRTMMLDIRKKAWSREICGTAGIPVEILPELVPSATELGRVTPAAAEQCGLSRNTRVFAGGHDHPCGALAAGILDSRSLLDSSGTAEQFFSIPDDLEALKPLAAEGFNMGLHVADGLHYASGAMTSSGRTVDWFAKTIGAGYDPSASRPGARGISFLPHLSGGSSPARDPRDCGAFAGLRAHHSPADMMQAVYEGLSFELKLGIGRLFASKPDRIVVTGGGTRNTHWMQIKANILQKELTIPTEYQSTALGAALLAGIGAGVYRDAADAHQKTFRIDRIYAPQSDYDYTVDFQRYAEIDAALHEIYKKY